MVRRLYPGSPADHQGAYGIDVERVCEALEDEVAPLSRVDLGRFAEVLRALADATDPAELRPVVDASGDVAAALPDDIHRRLLFACIMIFPEDVIDGVRAFVSRHLGPAGLLRFRLLETEGDLQHGPSAKS